MSPKPRRHQRRSSKWTCMARLSCSRNSAISSPAAEPVWCDGFSSCISTCQARELAARHGRGGSLGQGAAHESTPSARVSFSRHSPWTSSKGRVGKDTGARSSSVQLDAGAPDEVGSVGALLMGADGGFITGSDFLMDGGVTAAYWYGELAPR